MRHAFRYRQACHFAPAIHLRPARLAGSIAAGCRRANGIAAAACGPHGVGRLAGAAGARLVSRTGWGLYGAETLQQAIRHPAAVTSTVCFDAAAIHAGLAAMQLRQALQRDAGATHAVAWLYAGGSLTLVREDVGRHNALDKLLGALARKRVDFA